MAPNNSNNNNRAADEANEDNAQNNNATQGNEGVPSLQDFFNYILPFLTMDIGIVLQGPAQYPPIQANDPHMLYGVRVTLRHSKQNGMLTSQPRSTKRAIMSTCV